MKEGGQKYDAVLIHALGNKVIGSTPNRLAQRSRLVIRAAVELDEEYGIDTFVVSGSEFQGTRPLGLNIRDELVRRYHVPEDHIVFTTDRPSTTSEELEFLSDQADQNPSWTHLVHISLEAHRLSMIALKRKLAKKGRTIEFKTGEDILENLPSERNSQRYKRYFSGLHSTRDEIIWRIYEIVKFPFLLFPPTERLLNKLASRWRPQITKS